MKHRQKAKIASFLILAFTTVALQSHAGGAERQAKLDLSPELSGLLQAEMGALSEGVRSIALALAQADWKVLEATSAKMHESYIMKKSLTPLLIVELKERVPVDFRRLDEAFHARALKLQHAAERKDLELSTFHFSKLVESCAGCHAAYAAERFPGFAHGPDYVHQH